MLDKFQGGWADSALDFVGRHGTPVTVGAAISIFAASYGLTGSLTRSSIFTAVSVAAAWVTISEHIVNSRTDIYRDAWVTRLERQDVPGGSRYVATAVLFPESEGEGASRARQFELPPSQARELLPRFGYQNLDEVPVGAFVTKGRGLARRDESPGISDEETPKVRATFMCLGRYLGVRAQKFSILGGKIPRVQSIVGVTPITEDMQQAFAEARKKWGAGPNHFLVGSMGKFSPSARPSSILLLGGFVLLTSAWPK